MAALEALEPEWRSLEQRSTEPSLFSTFDYVSLAWRHFAATEPCELHVLAIRRADGQLAAVAPLRITRGRALRWLPTRTVHWIATWEGDRPELLHDGNLAEAWQQVALWFSRDYHHWDILSLAERPDDWMPDRTLCSVARADHWIDSVGYEIDLQQGFDAYIADRSRSVRGNWNKRRKRLLEGVPPAQVECVANPAQMHAAVDRFVAVEHGSWKHAAGLGVGKDAAHQAFYAGLATALARQGRCRIHFLILQGRDIAASLDFIAGGVVRARHVAYLEEQASNSPGTVLTLEMFKAFASEGLHHIDLMGLAPGTGVDRNKIDWSTSTYQTQTWLFFRNRGRLWPLYFRRRLRNWSRTKK